MEGESPAPAEARQEAAKPESSAPEGGSAWSEEIKPTREGNFVSRWKRNVGAVTERARESAEAAREKAEGVRDRLVSIMHGFLDREDPQPEEALKAAADAGGHLEEDFLEQPLGKVAMPEPPQPTEREQPGQSEEEAPKRPMASENGSEQPEATTPQEQTAPETTAESPPAEETTKEVDAVETGEKGVDILEGEDETSGVTERKELHAKSAKLDAVFQKLIDNPLVTDESRRKRQEFEEEVDEKIEEFREQFPDLEVAAGLAGSVQYGLATEDSDIDEVYFLRTKDGSPMTEDQWTEAVNSLESFSVRKFEDVKKMCAEGPVFTADTLDEAFWEDQETSLYWERVDTNRTNIVNRTLGVRGNIPWEKLSAISIIFSPTSAEQEEGEAVHRMRKEILETIAQRPDSSVLWDAVRENWQAQNVLVEQNTLSGKSRGEKIKKSLKSELEERRGREYSDEEVDKIKERLDKRRRELKLPEFEEIAADFGIDVKQGGDSTTGENEGN